jgi:hypothetical protein
MATGGRGSRNLPASMAFLREIFQKQSFLAIYINSTFVQLFCENF